MWHTMQEGVDVGGQDNLQELVRGIVLLAAYGGGGVVEADALVVKVYFTPQNSNICRYASAFLGRERG